MLCSVLSVLALSAVSLTSPATRAPLLDFAPTSGVRGRGSGDYRGKDNHWDEKDCIKGYLKLTTYDGQDYGYVGKKTTEYGAYTRASCDEDKLLVEIKESSWGAFDIKTLNGPDSWNPYFAGIVGWASTSGDIGKGSYNYFYLGGAAWPTLPGESAQTVANTFTSSIGVSRNVDSAIFNSFDKNTQCFDVQWVNCDHSCPETFVGVYEENQSCALFGTGDKDAVKAAFGKVTWVKLSFEQENSALPAPSLSV